MMDRDTITRHLTDEEGAPLTYRYSILERVGEYGLEYGIEIENSRGDRDSLPGLSTDRQAVEEFLALAAQLFLSPTHLRDVAQDWLGQ